jgi:transcriptional regulator with XRE-family HTH domain
MKSARSLALAKHIPARRATSADAEVGRRVRTFRMERELSQTDLAERIGVTFQQVQKYEKGVNRIGAGRLALIASALNQPITAFYSEVKTQSENGGAVADASMFALVQKRDAVQLLGYFAGIKSRSGRQTIVSMARELAAS